MFNSPKLRAYRVTLWLNDSRSEGVLMHSVSRRSFLLLAGSAALGSSPALSSDMGSWDHPSVEVAAVEHRRVLRNARSYLNQPPRTITSAPATRSAGGPHDYFSEGDYWWPDPKNPNGPYIRRDGQSNPDNFTAHRELLIRLSVQMPALTAAWLLTKKRAFCGSCDCPPPRMVHRSRYTHESQSRIRAGDSRYRHRPQHRHHRHLAPCRSGPGRVYSRTHRGHRRGRPKGHRTPGSANTSTG